MTDKKKHKLSRNGNKDGTGEIYQESSENENQIDS